MGHTPSAFGRRAHFHVEAAAPSLQLSRTASSLVEHRLKAAVTHDKIDCLARGVASPLH